MHTHLLEFRTAFSLGALSTHQELSAPAYVLDEYAEDARAMASERVLVLAERRYRFFHESFFDHAFARRFATRGDRVLDLLLSDEQHLFRRAQVRQILAFLRAHDPQRYLTELETVLTHGGVRYHIKALILQWMASLPDARAEEWNILQRLLYVTPEVRPHVRGVMAGNEGWFDVADDSRYLEEALASGDPAREEEVVWCFGLHSTLAARSGRVGVLFRQHRRPGKPWDSYVRYICRFGEVYHSREMFNLFLSLIDDGTLDAVGSQPTGNDNWWSSLYQMAEKRPECACEAIGHWFDRALVSWKGASDEANARNVARVLACDLREHLDRGMNGVHVILKAAKASRAFAEQMMPRIAGFVNQNAEDCGDRLATDPLWSLRSFGDDPACVHEALLCGLATSLETLARGQPAELDGVLAPFQDRPHDTIAYLVLRAWTAAPDRYADVLADYLAADPRRLKVGYSSWSGRGGSASSHVSDAAVRVAASHCSPGRLARLEEAIVRLTDDWEAGRPQIRGLRQLGLLEQVAESRLTPLGRKRLGELRRKFPAVDHTEPEPCKMTWLGPPVSTEAQAKMSDDHWIRAMQKYTGVNEVMRPGRWVGGERELANALEKQAESDAIRFAALAAQMPDSLPSAYFDAILLGVANSRSRLEDASPLIPLDALIQLIRRVHRLPTRPCGRWLAYLIEKWSGQDWPDDVIQAVGWYAANDPDPDSELWKTPSASGECYYGGEPFTAGMNFSRGAIAGAVASLIFDDPQRSEQLRDTVYALSHDPSVAVRACAVRALLAILSLNPPTAIEWFRECVAADPVLGCTHYVERFIYCALNRDYIGVRPVIQAMLCSGLDKAIEAGARLTCLAALDIEAARKDAQAVRSGPPAMRKSAAAVYGANIADKVVGAESRQRLMPFFVDPHAAVRAEAVLAFRKIADLPTEVQAELLCALLEANPDPKMLESVVEGLEDSPVQLPDLVCRLAERCIDAFRTEGSDLSKAGSAVAMDLSKIVIRLYTQAKDRAIQSRCLTLIDEMERHRFLGIREELQRLDR